MSDSPLVPILPNQSKPFAVDPEAIIYKMDVAWLDDLDAGHSPILETLIPSLEIQAVRRFKNEIKTAQNREPELTFSENGFENWRMFWLKEAHRNSSSYGSLKVANDHLSIICQAALNVMLAASALRNAIAKGKAELASALGILLICRAFEGGYSIKYDPMSETKEALDKAKKNFVRRTIGKQHDDLTKAKNACVSKAKQMWDKDPTLRIGSVAKECHTGLKLNITKLPSMKERDIPDIPAIKNWLKNAAAAKKLTIPTDAQKPGRPQLL